MNGHNSLKVVIAEDSNSMSAVIKRQLIKIGHTVIGNANNGLQAIEMAQTLQPDIILMDIEMPEMDGLEAARLIHEKCPRPVVLLTGHDDPELVQRASQVGVGAYLMKPPSAPEIERSIIIAMARFDDLRELQRLNRELQTALDNVKVLKGLVPICANCKKIRNDKGFWEALESYMKKNSDVEFSHGLCPDCIAKVYPDYIPKK
jgi:two-component system, response regulator PdtaR